MTCLNPKWIYLRKSWPIRKPEFEETIHILNKPKWTSSKNRYARLIPCHECIGCALDHASEWGTRAYMEYKTTKEGCFITLTYNNGFCTIKGHEGELSLKLTDKGKELYNLCINRGYNHYDTMKIINKTQAKTRDIMKLENKDLQLFWKRLRKKYPDVKIKYLASAEIGPKGGRTHFHAVVFGWKPLDLKYYKTNYQGDTLYSSSELETLWGNGFCTVGELNYKTACYTARYTQKKLIHEHKKHEEFTNNILKKEYQKYDIVWNKKVDIDKTVKITDELNKIYHIHNNDYFNKISYLNNFIKFNTKRKRIKYKKDVQEEFLRSSQKIGLQYWLENKQLIKKQFGINIVIDKKPKLAKIPTYFKKLWEEENWEEFERAKYKNILRGQKNFKNHLYQLNCPQDTPDWKKEIIFKQNQLFILNDNIDKLHRDNINSKNYYAT